MHPASGYTCTIRNCYNTVHAPYTFCKDHQSSPGSYGPQIAPRAPAWNLGKAIRNLVYKPCRVRGCPNFASQDHGLCSEHEFSREDGTSTQASRKGKSAAPPETPERAFCSIPDCTNLAAGPDSANCSYHRGSPKAQTQAICMDADCGDFVDSNSLYCKVHRYSPGHNQTGSSQSHGEPSSSSNSGLSGVNYGNSTNDTTQVRHRNPFVATICMNPDCGNWIDTGSLYCKAHRYSTRTADPVLNSQGEWNSQAGSSQSQRVAASSSTGRPAPTVVCDVWDCIKLSIKGTNRCPEHRDVSEASSRRPLPWERTATEPEPDTEPEPEQSYCEVDGCINRSAADIDYCESHRFVRIPLARVKDTALRARLQQQMNAGVGTSSSPSWERQRTRNGSPAPNRHRRRKQQHRVAVDETRNGNSGSSAGVAATSVSPTVNKASGEHSSDPGNATPSRLSGQEPMTLEVLDPPKSAKSRVIDRSVWNDPTRCQVDDCHLEKLEAKDYCLLHCCKLPRCSLMACTIGGYCEDIHACSVPGCMVIRASVIDTRYKNDQCRRHQDPAAELISYKPIKRSTVTQQAVAAP